MPLAPPDTAALLAFDTSTEQLSVAVSAQGRVFARQAAGGPQSSATLIPTVVELLAEAGVELRALGAIAFGRGPGSFTGLRTACAVAQGLGFGAGVPLLPVDTLLVVAEDARARHGVQRVVVAMDARMDEVYAAVCDFTAGPAPRIESRVLAPEALEVPPGFALAGNAHAVYGPRLAPRAGDAPRLAAAPTAEAMLRLAPALLAAGHAVPAEQAAPLYIRDKVAQTTEERAAARTAAAAATAGHPAA